MVLFSRSWADMRRFYFLWLKNKISMREEVSLETSKLRDIVAKQAEKTRATVSVAQTEQEKSLSIVNGMIRKTDRPY